MTTSLASSRQRTAALAHALSDETRLGIIEALRHGERCVCDLVTDLDAAQSRLSFHLRVLREAGLVTDRREGRWSFYTLAPEAMTELHDAVVSLRPIHTLPVLGGGCCG
ncbi:MAG: metalloregulator ArsR/SmtB family transcription factor [Gemmatimonadota bacterium]